MIVVAAAAAAGPHLGGGGALGISLTRIVAALLICTMLAVVAGLLLKRGGGRIDLGAIRDLAGVRADRRIAVIETRRISQHADACLLRCDGRDYLILSSQASQQVLRQEAVALCGDTP